MKRELGTNYGGKFGYYGKPIKCPYCKIDYTFENIDVQIESITCANCGRVFEHSCKILIEHSTMSSLLDDKEFNRAIKINNLDEGS